MAGLNPGDFEDVSGPPAPAGGGMNPADFEEVQPQAKPAPKDVVTGQEIKPSALATGVRAFGNVLSSDFLDEVSGWVDAAVQEHSLFPSAEAYRQHRDKYRQVTKQGIEEHPWANRLGQAAGIVAMARAGGPEAAAPSLLKAAGKGALVGGLYGLGGSEADLTKGEWRQAVEDTLKGGAIGAGAGVVGQKIANWLKGAPVREEAKQLSDLKTGIQYSTKLKTFGKATAEAPGGQFTEAIKGALKDEPQIAKAIQKTPPKAIQLVDAHMSKLGEQLDTIYDKAQDASPGVPLTTVLKSLHKVEQQYEKNSATAPLAKQVAGVIDHLRETWGDHNVVKNVGQMPFQSLREEYRAWQDVANRASKVFSSQSPREEVSEAMSNAMREALQDHIDTVATRNPSLGISRKLLEETNQKFSTWSKVQRALTEKVTRQNVGAPTMGEMIGKVVHAGAHPLATAAKAIGTAASPAAERLLDPRMAALSRAAQAGDNRAAQLLQFMLKGPSVGAPIAAVSAYNQANASAPSEPQEAPPETEQPVAAAP